MSISITPPTYTIVTVNTVTATNRRSRTYFINTALIPKLPSVNTMRELQLTKNADYVIEDNNLVKCRGDINEILIKALIC